MHTYPLNSPRAAARLVALTMVADGHVCRAELDAARAAVAEAELGVSSADLQEILQTLCEDLLQSAHASGTSVCGIDDDLLRTLLDEVDDPVLQRKVAMAIVATAEADGHLSDGELFVLEALQHHWGLRPSLEPVLGEVRQRAWEPC